MSDAGLKDPHSKWSVVIYGIVGFSLGCIIAAVFYSMLLKQIKHQEDWQRMHVKSIEAIDRNCNECHLGLSFIELFDNPFVRSNDNVVNKMLDGAKIKRW